jgi:Pvc16 N-terminal domain
LATYQAIAAVSAALRALLSNAAIPPISGAEFLVVNADSLQSPMADGLGVFLYRASVNTAIHTVPGRPSLALDLHYFVTAWSGDPIRQQLLLGWAARRLEDSPILTSAMLNQHAPAPGVFRPDESVELAAESLNIQDEVSVWNAVKALQQPSVTYVARGVRIDS